MTNGRMERMWKSKLPMKIQVFMWMACQGRVQSGEALKQMNWKRDPSWKICGAMESVDHIFFSCILVKFTWGCLAEALGWERSLTSLDDFMGVWLPLGCKNYGIKLESLGMVMWSLCTTRNKVTIKGEFPKSLFDTLFKINSCMQKWQTARGADYEVLKEWTTQARRWMKTFMQKLKDITT
jgi:hypothetical protein